MNGRGLQREPDARQGSGAQPQPGAAEHHADGETKRGNRRDERQVRPSLGRQARTQSVEAALQGVPGRPSLAQQVVRRIHVVRDPGGKLCLRRPHAHSCHRARERSRSRPEAPARRIKRGQGLLRGERVLRDLKRPNARRHDQIRRPAPACEVRVVYQIERGPHTTKDTTVGGRIPLGLRGVRRAQPLNVRAPRTNERERVRRPAHRTGAEAWRLACRASRAPAVSWCPTRACRGCLALDRRQQGTGPDCHVGAASRLTRGDATTTIAPLWLYRSLYGGQSSCKSPRNRLVPSQAAATDWREP